MNVLEAHEFFASLTRDDRAELLPVDFNLRNIEGHELLDGWPAAVTAALLLINWLPQLETERDLLEGVRHVSYLFQQDLLDREEWKVETGRVVEEVVRWGMAGETAAAGWN